MFDGKENWSTAYLLPLCDMIIKIAEGMLLTATFRAASELTGSTYLLGAATLVAMASGGYVGAIAGSIMHGAVMKFPRRRAWWRVCLALTFGVATGGTLYAANKISNEIVRQLSNTVGAAAVGKPAH